MSLPIEYKLVVRHAGGEAVIDLTEAGWLNREELKSATSLTLIPPDEVELPVVSVSLAPLPDGTEKRYICFSRVFGRMAVDGSGSIPLFRLYCLGWQATIAGRVVKAMNWIYPNGGSVVMSDEPPFVDQLLDYYAALVTAKSVSPDVEAEAAPVADVPAPTE